MGIALQNYGGISFYQRKEIKDFLGYLRVIVNTGTKKPYGGSLITRFVVLAKHLWKKL
jgi:superfamily I DNA/RNA helicase